MSRPGCGGGEDRGRSCRPSATRPTSRCRWPRRAEAARRRRGVLLRPPLAAWASPTARRSRPSRCSARVAAATARISLGTLVARIGLVPDEVLVSEFAPVDVLAPGRVVAGLGTGDHLSAAENGPTGSPSGPADERRGRWRRCARIAAARGLAVWVGGARADDRGVAEAEPGRPSTSGRPARRAWPTRPAAPRSPGAGPCRRRAPTGLGELASLVAGCRRPAPPGRCSAGRSRSRPWRRRRGWPAGD